MSRILPHFTSAGLAELLRKYTYIDADKTHQLSDVKERPIPYEMCLYAISDTIYLLGIYDKMALELKEHESDDISIKSVLDASKKVCLIHYQNKLFIPSSYAQLIDSTKQKKKGMVLSEKQEQIAEVLRYWRNATDREEDEPTQYVLFHSDLLEIASACVNLFPTLILNHSNHILRLVKDCLFQQFDSNHHQQQPPTKTLHIQKASQKLICKSTTCPAYNTDALYNDEKWMTPQALPPSGADYNGHSSVTSKGSKPDILIHSTKTNFQLNSYTSHSLEMRTVDNSEDGNQRAQSVDGFGIAKFVSDQMQDDSFKIQNQDVQKCAGRIRNGMMSKNQNLTSLEKSPIL